MSRRGIFGNSMGRGEGVNSHAPEVDVTRAVIEKIESAGYLGMWSICTSRNGFFLPVDTYIKSL